MKLAIALFIRDALQRLHWRADQRGWHTLSNILFERVIHVQDCYVDFYSAE